MKSYEIPSDIGIQQENKETEELNTNMMALKNNLDEARKLYIGKDKRTLQILDIYSDLRVKIYADYEGLDHPITNSWMKLWEIIISMNLLPNNSNTVFCNAELPGNFIYALNMLLKYKREKIKMVWFFFVSR